MGYVTVTESVGEVMKTYHFESYDDFKDWENKISGVVVSAPEADEYGWIVNPGYCPVPKGTLVDVKHRDGRVYECVRALDSLEGAEDWSINTNEPEDGDIMKYRVVSK